MGAAALWLLPSVLMGQTHLGGLLKPRLLGPTPEFLVQSGVEPENLISNKSPGNVDPDAAGPGTLP